MRHSVRFTFIPIFILIQLIAFGGQSQGGVWTLFKEGETFFHYYFKDTVKKSSDGVVSVWIRSVPQPDVQLDEILEQKNQAGFPLKVSQKEYGYSLLFLKVNCQEKTARFIQEKVFNKEGYPVVSFFHEEEWKSIRRDPILTGLSIIVCPSE